MEEQRVILENRNKMTVSQVVDVDAFDEETLWANPCGRRGGGQRQRTAHREAGPCRRRTGRDGQHQLVRLYRGQEAKGQQTPQSLGGQTAQ